MRKIYFCALLLVLLITPHFFGEENVFPVLIPDSSLRLAVLSQLELPEDHELNQEDLLQLTSLRARSAGIADLSGLEFARNLIELDLRDNSIRTIEPLRELSNLTWLSLRENPHLQDISPLSGLIRLEYLNLNYSSFETNTTFAPGKTESSFQA